MRKIFMLVGTIVIFVLMLMAFLGETSTTSASNTILWDGRVEWDGQGYQQPCQSGAHWILSGNGLDITAAVLTVGNWER